jgi:exopolyphosphatase / guanosine-5'-triphosphate,3'-diphosphate pyrophosphatase
MRVAIVDVGSNTARLLVADVARDRVVPVLEQREYLSLGAELARTGALSAGTLRELAHVCEGYARIARGSSIERAIAIVTAPGRQGRSVGTLLRVLAEATGFRVRVLSAGEEGRYAYVGAVASVREQLPNLIGVVDVGGGSTEIAVGEQHDESLWVRSIDLGSVRLTSTQLVSDPPGKRELKRARASVRVELGRLKPPHPELVLAVGGSARAIARITGRAFFGADDIDEVVRILARHPSAYSAREFGMHPIRAASAIGGAVLLAETSRLLESPLEVAGGGVREGAALALAAAGLAAAA